jgi:hypothetical protein
MISSDDHPSMAHYYADQTQQLRERVEEWEFTAEFYEKNPEQHAKPNTAQHVVLAGPSRKLLQGGG